MAILRIVPTFLAVLGVVAIAHAGIFKWVDDQGNVHFGDRPPEGATAELVSTESDHPEQTGPGARERTPQVKAEADNGVAEGKGLSLPQRSNAGPDEDHHHGEGDCCKHSHHHRNEGVSVRLTRLMKNQRSMPIMLFGIGFVNMIVPCPTAAVMYGYALNSGSTSSATLVFGTYAISTAIAL